MRGSDMRTGELFSYVDLEKRVPEHHPLRLIRRIVNEVLADLDREFAELYAAEGRPSIAPERLLRALLLQAFYTIPLGTPVDGAVALQFALPLVRRSWRG
jgi:transposase